MKNYIKSYFASFKRLFSIEDGLATVEFVAMFPAAMLVLFVAGESALTNVKKTNLDRALEMTVRDLRMGLIETPTLGTLRSLMCERMGDPDNCAADLTLELSVRSTMATNMTVPSLTANCVNIPTEIDPALSYGVNELILVRACYVVDVIFPTSVGSMTVAEAMGDDHQLVSTTAFVNEP